MVFGGCCGVGEKRGFARVRVGVRAKFALARRRLLARVKSLGPGPRARTRRGVR
jgi:hypothetical protein